jgi:hypothetical protein
VKATACFYFTKRSFGEVIILCFIAEFILRTIFYTIYNSIGSKGKRARFIEDGVYAAFTYAWRSLFLSFDFQSYRPLVFVWFYLENLLMIGGSYGVITYTEIDLSEKSVYHTAAILAGVGSLLALLLRIVFLRVWRKEHNKVTTLPANS